MTTKTMKSIKDVHQHFDLFKHPNEKRAKTTNMEIIVDNNSKFIVIDEYRKEFQ